MELRAIVKGKISTREEALPPRLSVPLLRGRAYPVLLLLVIAIFYHAWLTSGFITAGDFPYFTLSHLIDAVPFPSLWDSTSSTGGYNILNAPMFPLESIQGIMAALGIDWSVSERVLWVIPAVVVPSASTYALSLSLFRQHLAAFISAVAVVMNSYVYLLYEGGQFGVAVAYGCLPLILWAFVRGQRRGTIGGFVFTGILMAVQAMYDIRSTYITVGVLLLYGLVCCVESVAVRGCIGSNNAARGRTTSLTVLGVPHIVVSLMILTVLHLWWILPALLVQTPQLPSGYADVAGVHPLSHMQLDNSLALFHPFWFANDVRIAPINPLFFIAPLLIFGTLLRRRYNRPVLFLITVALIAAFLVKGDNDPAGRIYDWLFAHLPGFSYFRDPSKFYQPLALAYALLLGIAGAWVRRVVRDAITMQPRWVSAVVAAVFLGLAAFPAYPALAQQARGAFVVGPVPADYARFNNFVDHQRDFFRVLWIPARPRFGTFSTLHPALDAAAISACCIKTMSTRNQSWSWLRSPLAAQTLRVLSVRYIVVPTETVGDDFIGQPAAVVNTPSAPVLAAIRALLSNRQEWTIGRLHIFGNSRQYPLIFAAQDSSRASGSSLLNCIFGAVCFSGLSSVPHVRAIPHVLQPIVASYSASGSLYEVRIHIADKPAYLVLQQTYDPHWLAFVEHDQEHFHWWMLFQQKPLPVTDHMVANGYANAWLIRKPGTYHVILEYWPQQLVLAGLLLAVTVLLVGGSFMLIYARKQRRVLSLSLEANS